MPFSPPFTCKVEKEIFGEAGICERKTGNRSLDQYCKIVNSPFVKIARHLNDKSKRRLIVTCHIPEQIRHFLCGVRPYNSSKAIPAEFKPFVDGYAALSELAHPTRTAANNSVTLAAARRGIEGAKAELAEAEQNNPERIRHALYRLIWLLSDEDEQFVKIPVDLKQMPNSEKFVSRLRPHRTWDLKGNFVMASGKIKEDTVFFFLVICILVLAAYAASKTHEIGKHQSVLAEFLQTELKDIKAAQKLVTKPLSYGWFDDGFPADISRQEERAPLENPSPQNGADEYMTQMFIEEYRSMADSHHRKEYLRHLWNNGTWIRSEFLDVIYADQSEYVRAWAAGHLNTDFKDYSDWQNPVEIKNYEPALLGDRSPIVKAALWSNPNCHQLPWSMIWISDNWKEHFKGLSQLERLGLMRNPNLSLKYVVALMETSSEELEISVSQHVEILAAAGQNPRLITSSRRTGRGVWAVDGDANSPFEEYGRMWELALDRWIDKPPVPYVFLKYIQTTPEVKLAAYNRLLGSGKENDTKWLRAEVIRSCDPFDDKEVLKHAWEDPDEECRQIAEERVGHLTDYVGLKKRKSN